MKVKDILDELETCVRMVWVPDRIGGYSEPQLDRRKASKIIKEALKDAGGLNE